MTPDELLSKMAADLEDAVVRLEQERMNHLATRDMLNVATERAEAAEARCRGLEAECASISAEFDLPPAVRPAEGEIRRMREGWRESRAKLATARQEALEEAAKVAEVWLHIEPKSGWGSGDALDAKAEYSNGTVHRIASAIRALTQETDKETP